MKSRTYSDKSSEDDGGGPFLPLEETVHSIRSSSSVDDKNATATPPPSSGGLVLKPHFQFLVDNSNNSAVPMLAKLDGKKVMSTSMLCLIFLLVWDSLFAKPENRILKPDFAQHFLTWVQAHPASGLVWILIFMSVAVIFMIPIGTPLTLGCGYIYKGAYGWRLGVLIATCVSMLGSALGAICCFLMGRYLMRDTVRKWIRKYPLFDAIDIAAAEHGLRIMAMLYLTPILPLGPVSYMCGTTSMALSHFIIAKVAALPLMMLYVFIGASTGTLMSTSSNKGAGSADVGMSEEQVKSIEENQTLIVSGILLSAVSIACITHYIKKELNKILERQKRQQNEDGGGDDAGDPEAAAGVEMGKTAPRQRKH
jgi:uncharacterized membrane protein YdjX (TVP38/TMEM64 family)